MKITSVKANGPVDWRGIVLGPGDWKGIVINPTSVSSSITYADIQGADTAIAINGTAVNIRNSTIANFKTNGIAMKAGAGGIIDNNDIHNVATITGTGIFLEDASSALNNNSLTVSGNRINTTNAAIYVTGQSDT